MRERERDFPLLDLAEGESVQEEGPAAELSV